MIPLLEHTNTYYIYNLITVSKDITSFNKLFKNLKELKDVGKHHPTIPISYSLPKIRKQDTPTTHYLLHR